MQLRAARSNKGIKFVAVTSKDRFPGLPEVPPISATLAGYDQPAAMGLMTIPGAGHMPMIEQPDQFTDALRNFLERIGGAR